MWAALALLAAAQDATPARPTDRREMLETIAFTLRGSALSDPFEDLASWVVGVEVVEGLQRAGFTVVRTTPATASDATA